MTVIRVRQKSSPGRLPTSTPKTIRVDQSPLGLEMDISYADYLSHLNRNELQGVEFESGPTHWSWFSKKRRLFAGTKDF